MEFFVYENDVRQDGYESVREVARSPPRQSAERSPLESILLAQNSKPTLNTDVCVFLVIAGWTIGYSLPGWDRLGQAKRQELDKKLYQNYRSLRSRLSSREKGLQARFTKALEIGYANGDFKTLRELKEMTEEGQGRRLCYRKVGYKSLAFFNKTLIEYGLESIQPVRWKGQSVPR